MRCNPFLMLAMLRLRNNALSTYHVHLWHYMMICPVWHNVVCIKKIRLKPVFHWQLCIMKTTLVTIFSSFNSTWLCTKLCLVSVYTYFYTHTVLFWTRGQRLSQTTDFSNHRQLDSFINSTITTALWYSHCITRIWNCRVVSENQIQTI